MIKNSVQRFREIVKTLTFYGFGYILDSKIKNKKSDPSNLRKAFEKLGPTFVKIGQILSTRPDILPQNYIEELSKLQDNVSPESFEDINKVFFNEFKQSINDVFDSFNKVPFASASIAQVHEATLKDGRNVIVKIQRPEIAEKIKLDIAILLKISKLSKITFIDTLVDPKEALYELKNATEEELDFKNEAKNIDIFRDLNKNVDFVNVPYIIHGLSTKKIITMEKIDGIKIDNLNLLKENGYNLSDLSKNLTLSFCKQIFEDGFFHGDPHPGNILVKKGIIYFIDFGIVGRLSTSLKSSLREIVFALALKDINKLVSIIMSIGIKTGVVDRNNLFEDIDYLLSNYISTSLSNIKISVLFEDILHTAKRNNIRFPKEFTMLIRSLIIIEGVISKLSPDVKIIDILISYVKSNNKFYLFKNFDLIETLITYSNFAKSITHIPTKIIELSDSIIHGRAKIQLTHKNLEKNVNTLNKMVNRLIIGLVISSIIIGSSLILTSNIGPKYANMSVLGLTGFAIAAFMGFWLLIFIIKSGKI